MRMIKPIDHFLKKKVYVAKLLDDTAAPQQDTMSFVLLDERFSCFQSKCSDDLKKTGMLLHTSSQHNFLVSWNPLKTCWVIFGERRLSTDKSNLVKTAVNCKSNGIYHSLILFWRTVFSLMPHFVCKSDTVNSICARLERLDQTRLQKANRLSTLVKHFFALLAKTTCCMLK